MRAELVTAAAALTAAVLLNAAPVRAADPAVSPSLGSALLTIDQARIDAAMERLRQRIDQRRANPPATQPAAETNGSVGSTRVEDPIAQRKLAMLQQYDQRVADARAALRRGEAKPDDVRAVLNEQSALQRLPLERFASLVAEADALNAQRIARYQAAFGELRTASQTVITILMKAGLVDTASEMADDPLSEEVELGRGVRRVYYQFILPGRDGTVPPRRHNGYVEFQLATTHGLWLPTWADLEGSPLPLFDAEAFLPLRPYSLLYSGSQFMVAQDQTHEPPSMLFSLLAPRFPSGMTVNSLQQR